MLCVQGESDYLCVGNDITHVEAVRSTLKTQFDRNVVVNFSSQEQVLDYAFSHLGLGGESCDKEGRVPHPVVMTEPVCNPIYSRSCRNVGVAEYSRDMGGAKSHRGVAWAESTSDVGRAEVWMCLQ